MIKLTTERLETIATWREKYGNSANVMIPAEEAELMARQILAYEQAANEVACWGVTGQRGQIYPLSPQTARMDSFPLYRAPVLPKQPELVENLKKVMNNWLAMEPKLAFQPEFTDVMMLIDAEPAPSQHAIPEQKIVGWIFEDELPKNYPYDAMFVHSKVDVVRMFPVYAPSAAQPVSEPYKLPDGWKLVPIEPTPKMRTAGKHAIKGCDSIFESVIAECVYGAMVNAAPAQESE